MFLFGDLERDFLLDLGDLERDFLLDLGDLERDFLLDLGDLERDFLLDLGDLERDSCRLFRGVTDRFSLEVDLEWVLDRSFDGATAVCPACCRVGLGVAKPASEPVEQPLSYAEYIVRKNNAAALEGSSKLLNADDAGETTRKQSESDSGSSAAGVCDPLQGHAEGGEGESGGVKTSEDPQVAGTHQKEGNCQRSDPILTLGPKPMGSGSSIIVSPRQVTDCLTTVKSVNKTDAITLLSTFSARRLYDVLHKPFLKSKTKDG
ncbi:DNA excision repair protein ERCC-1 [Liparis tanakae]|uniref:DNA excision repair protein ERCC-1 n=1 Tax=Liparis tanakae TaxID=230148 RepID=A0A4Z2GKW7_9TELE|nr:DNA excision repair protein ERCC-1 [Liparis tanakae]